jgi:hypothetical protein
VRATDDFVGPVGLVPQTTDLHTEHIQRIRDKMPLRAYGGVSKIFRTDAVKIIKLAIRPVGRHHPRSSSLPHVDTGPTVSISGTLPGSPFLSRVSSTLCDLAWISSMVSNRRPFSFNLFLEIERNHRVPNQGSAVSGG